MTSNIRVNHHMVFSIHGKPDEITASSPPIREAARSGRLGCRERFVCMMKARTRNRLEATRQEQCDLPVSDYVLRQPRSPQGSSASMMYSLHGNAIADGEPANVIGETPAHDSVRVIVIRWTKVFHLHLLLDSKSLGESCRQ